jgi:hypothetical protein
MLDFTHTKLHQVDATVGVQWCVMKLHSIAFAVLVALGCSATPPSSSTPLSNPVDSGVDPLPDAGTPVVDASADATRPDDILGALQGSCGELRAELTTMSPSLKVDTLTFMAGESYTRPSLSPGGQRLFDTPNAGGSSTESEVMSYEVLRHCEGATLLKTETEVGYTPPVTGQPNSITDLLVEIAGKRVGVSVTRAYKPAAQGPQTDAEVKALLEKKLDGINVSSARVLPADKWVKQVLHVFAATQASVEAINRVLPTIAAAIRADTIVFVTRTSGGGFIYCDPDPPLGKECM